MDLDDGWLDELERELSAIGNLPDFSQLERELNPVRPAPQVVGTVLAVEWVGDCMTAPFSAAEIQIYDDGRKVVGRTARLTCWPIGGVARAGLGVVEYQDVGSAAVYYDRRRVARRTVVETVEV